MTGKFKTSTGKDEDGNVDMSSEDEPEFEGLTTSTEENCRKQEDKINETLHDMTNKINIVKKDIQQLGWELKDVNFPEVFVKQVQASDKYKKEK